MSAVPVAVPVAPDQGLSRWKVPPQALTLAEALALLGILILSAIAVAGLAGSYLGIFGWATLVLGAIVLLGVLGALVARLGLPRMVLDPLGLVIAAGAAIVAAVMFLPGFHYGGGDRDPGVYMEVGAHMAQTGSLRLTSEALAADGLPVQPYSPGALFPGLWVTDSATGAVTPQFYHLWSALLGVGYLLRGIGGSANVTPLVGVLAVVLAVLIGRRIGGPFVAVATGLLLSTNMMQVWQAKYPSTEILSQSLFLGMMLSLIIAIRANSRSAALVSGVLVSVGYLARPDGVLMICLATGVLGWLWILRRWDARAGWFTGGMVVVGIFGVYQAYGVSAAYTNDTLPSALDIFGAIGAVIVGSLVLRVLLAGSIPRINAWINAPKTQRIAGIVLVALMFVGTVLLVIRPRFGEIMINYNGRIIRSYAEQSLYWISWFFTWPGLALAFVGTAWLILRRWTASTWALILPLGALLPVYLWNPRNSPYLMWWGRRFVPVIVPSLVLMIALALALAWLTRPLWWGIVLRALSVVALGALTVVFVLQSWPLRSHDELGGTYFIGKEISALAPAGEGVYVWDNSFPCCGSPTAILGGPLWLTHGQTSLVMPSDVTRVNEFLDAYLEQWPDRELFVILPGDTVPERYGSSLDKYQLTPVRQVQQSIPLWESSATHRPAKATPLSWNFTVYRVTAR